MIDKLFFQKIIEKSKKLKFFLLWMFSTVIYCTEDAEEIMKLLLELADKFENFWIGLNYKFGKAEIPQEFLYETLHAIIAED